MACSQACPAQFQLGVSAVRASHKWAWNDEAARLHVLRALVQATAEDASGAAAWTAALPTLWQLERQLFIVSRGNRADYMGRAAELLAVVQRRGLAGVQADDTGGSLAWQLDQPALAHPCRNAKADALARLACVRLEPPQDVGSGGVRCRKCGARDVDVVMRQTRAADEGMTAFVTCRACGHSW